MKKLKFCVHYKHCIQKMAQQNIMAVHFGKYCWEFGVNNFELSLWCCFNNKIKREEQIAGFLSLMKWFFFKAKRDLWIFRSKFHFLFQISISVNSVCFSLIAKNHCSTCTNEALSRDLHVAWQAHCNGKNCFKNKIQTYFFVHWV